MKKILALFLAFSVSLQIFGFSVYASDSGEETAETQELTEEGAAQAFTAEELAEGSAAETPSEEVQDSLGITAP